MSDDIVKRAMAWLSGSGDTGLSSEAIMAHMLGGTCDGSYPHDAADLGRCIRLLDRIPEWRPRMREMGRYGTAWIVIADRWEELEATMEEEVGRDWSKGKSAKKTCDLLYSMEGEGFKRDPNWTCELNSSGHLRSAQRKDGSRRRADLGNSASIETA